MTGNDDVLHRLRNEYWQGMSGTEEDEDQQGAMRQYLVFLVRDRRFAFETSDCRQIFRVPPVVPLPCVPAHIKGIINVRGRVVSVTDLAVLFGMPGAPPDSRARLIVVSDEERQTAVVVDGISRIIDFEDSRIQQSSVAGPGNDFSTGELLVEGQIIVVLSVARILDAPGMEIDFRRNDAR